MRTKILALYVFQNGRRKSDFFTVHVRPKVEGWQYLKDGFKGKLCRIE